MFFSADPVMNTDQQDINIQQWLLDLKVLLGHYKILQNNNGMKHEWNQMLK